MKQLKPNKPVVQSRTIIQHATQCRYHIHAKCTCKFYTTCNWYFQISYKKISGIKTLIQKLLQHCIKTRRIVLPSCNNDLLVASKTYVLSSVQVGVHGATNPTRRVIDFSETVHRHHALSSPRRAHAYAFTDSGLFSGAPVGA